MHCVWERFLQSHPQGLVAPARESANAVSRLPPFVECFNLALLLCGMGGLGLVGFPTHRGYHGRSRRLQDTTNHITLVNQLTTGAHQPGPLINYSLSGLPRLTWLTTPMKIFGNYWLPTWSRAGWLGQNEDSVFVCVFVNHWMDSWVSEGVNPWMSWCN